MYVYIYLCVQVNKQSAERKESNDNKKDNKDVKEMKCAEN